jgi:hypothetical protein
MSKEAAQIRVGERETDEEAGVLPELVDLDVLLQL